MGEINLSSKSRVRGRSGG